MNNANPWYWNVQLQQTLGNGDFRWNVFLQETSSQQQWEPHYINRYSSGVFFGVGITLKPWDGWTFGAAANNLIAALDNIISLVDDQLGIYPKNVLDGALNLLWRIVVCAQRTRRLRDEVLEHWDVIDSSQTDGNIHSQTFSPRG